MQHEKIYAKAFKVISIPYLFISIPLNLLEKHAIMNVPKAM